MMVATLGGRQVSGFKSMGFVMINGGEPPRVLAVMEARTLGQIRTGAASQVATKHMARKDASTIGIIGTGH